MQRRLPFYWLAVIFAVVSTIALGQYSASAYLVGCLAYVAVALVVVADYLIEVGPGPAVYSFDDQPHDELVEIFVTSGRVRDYDTALVRLLEHGRIAAACRACDRFTVTAEQPAACSGCGEPKELLSTGDALDLARARHRAENLRLWKGRGRSLRERLVKRLR